MNWDAIVGRGEIIAAIAMIGTFVYLVREVGPSVAHSIRGGYDKYRSSASAPVTSARIF